MVVQCIIYYNTIKYFSYLLFTPHMASIKLISPIRTKRDLETNWCLTASVSSIADYGYAAGPLSLLGFSQQE